MHCLSDDVVWMIIKMRKTLTPQVHSCISSVTTVLTESLFCENKNLFHILNSYIKYNSHPISAPKLFFYSHISIVTTMIQTLTLKLKSHIIYDISYNAIGATKNVQLQNASVLKIPYV